MGAKDRSEYLTDEYIEKGVKLIYQTEKKIDNIDSHENKWKFMRLHNINVSSLLHFLLLSYWSL